MVLKIDSIHIENKEQDNILKKKQNGGRFKE